MCRYKQSQETLCQSTYPDTCSQHNLRTSFTERPLVSKDECVAASWLHHPPRVPCSKASQEPQHAGCVLSCGKQREVRSISSSIKQGTASWHEVSLSKPAPWDSEAKHTYASRSTTGPSLHENHLFLATGLTGSVGRHVPCWLHEETLRLHDEMHHVFCQRVKTTQQCDRWTRGLLQRPAWITHCSLAPDQYWGELWCFFSTVQSYNSTLFHYAYLTHVQCYSYSPFV